MANTFLLEIGTEELPADFVRSALQQLERRVRTDLKELRLDHGHLSVTGTPRRLLVQISDLIDSQPDLEEDRKGPPVSQALVDGQPGPAAIGFAKRCGVDPAQLESRDTPKGPCLFARVCTPGQRSSVLLQDFIPQWIDCLQGRRFMRWGSGEQRFSRPVRWLVALLGEALIPVTLHSSDPIVRSGRQSRGHRLHDSLAQLNSADELPGLLAEAGVMVDRDQRSELIRRSIAAEAVACGGEADCPDSLFQELVDLVEAPLVLRGEIADRYLDLPPEVIVTVMQSHQRYVPLRQPKATADPLQLEARNVLRSDFLLVGNGLQDASETIVSGNQRVLSARLADAEFFLNVDRRQPSEQRREELDRVTFAEGLGSLLDRTERISWMLDQLVQLLRSSDSLAEHARRAARLCKNDLVSQMVGEFPELQGLMGGKYLLEEGEHRDVALAVAEHYQPAGAGDAPPCSDAGALLALAERLELLLSIFSKGQRPTGSSDPYALRRAGNGIVQILWDRGWRLPLQTLLGRASSHWSGLFPAFQFDPASLAEDLGQLLRQRMVSQFEEDGFPADLVQAVSGAGVSSSRLLEDPVDARVRLLLLRDLRTGGRLQAVQAVVQRASKLAEKGNLDTTQLDAEPVIDASLFDSPSETDLLKQLQTLSPLAQACDYEGLASELQGAARALEAFFDGENSVMVMTDNDAVRRNRLNLLGVLRNQASVLARFENIQA
ncbi:MAG: Glycine--tRNA ligase beta subunit [Cyanobium sp. ARS6]|nr:MAG: Glycine--tRNA ligase beta subunit [Cyanobium sp. ARS6]